jgi:hypothetical protein
MIAKLWSDTQRYSLARDEDGIRLIVGIFHGSGNKLAEVIPAYEMIVRAANLRLWVDRRPCNRFC